MSIVSLLVISIILLLLGVQMIIYGAVKLFVELTVKPNLEKIDIFK